MKKTSEHDFEPTRPVEQTRAEEKTDAVKADAAAPSAESAGPSTESASEETPSAGQVPDSEARIAELQKLNSDLQDQYLRKAADFDNYRKRMIREKQEAIDYANTNLLLDLLETLDNFDRAIDAAGSHEPGTPVASFADGVGMIRTQLAGKLESKYGLSYYPSVGTAFDPNIHEAIGTVQSPEATEPVVQEEYVKGYKLKDKVVRLAKVIVKMPAPAEN